MRTRTRSVTVHTAKPTVGVAVWAPNPPVYDSPLDYLLGPDRAQGWRVLVDLWRLRRAQLEALKVRRHIAPPPLTTPTSRRIRALVITASLIALLVAVVTGWVDWSYTMTWVALTYSYASWTKERVLVRDRGARVSRQHKLRIDSVELTQEPNIATRVRNRHTLLPGGPLDHPVLVVASTDGLYREEWRLRDAMHRLDGPARIFNDPDRDGDRVNVRWHVDGILIASVTPPSSS